MKRLIIFALAVFTAPAAFAQYPNAPNKMRLGAQTTGDGLLYRHAGAPSWTPTGINNAWQSIDTLTGDLYTYRNGTWFLEVKGDLQQVYPVVINKSGVNIKRGEVVSVDTSQIIQGDQIRIMRAIGDGGLSPKLIMGVAATDINNDATGYVAWFGYVREAVEANIAETGVTLNVGDILYLSATEPGRLTNVEPTPPALKSTIALLVRKPSVNNLTLLVRPSLNENLSDLNDVDLNGVGNGQTIVWDSLNMKWIAGNVGTPIDTSLIATKSYVDSKVDSTRLTQDSILVYYIGGAEVGRDTLSLPPAGVTSITAGVGLTGGTITSTGTIAADTATVLVTKTFLTNQGYGTGTVTGSGTSGQVSYWNSTTSQTGSNNLFWDAVNSRFGIGTTTPETNLTAIGTTTAQPIGVFRHAAATNSNFLLGLEDANITMPNFSGLGLQYSPNAVGIFALSGQTNGGLDFIGLTKAGGFALAFEGYAGTAPGTSPVTLFRVGKHNGSTNATALAASEIAYRFDNSGNALFRIMGNGNTIIQNGGTFTDAGFRLDVNGTARFQGNTTITGTGFLNLPSGTTAERPGTPTVGMMRNNNSNNNLDFYTGTAWENPLKSATATGLGTANRVFISDANGRATTSSTLQFNPTGGPLDININDGAGNDKIIRAKIVGATGEFGVFNGSSLANIFLPTFYGYQPDLNLSPLRFAGIANARDISSNATLAAVSISGWKNADISDPTITNPNPTFLEHMGILEVRNWSNTLMFINTAGRMGIKNNAPQRDLHVTGEARITDLTTDTPTQIVGADADGDLGAITVGSGLTLSGGNLSVTTPNGVTNLSFAEATPSRFLLGSDTGTDVAFEEGDGIDLSLSGSTLTVGKATPLYAVITVDSNRTSSFLAGSVTPDTIDNPILSQVGGVFSVVGNGIQYTSGTARTFLITANADFKFSEANNIVKFQGWRSNGGTVIDLGTFGTVESVLGNEIMHTSFTAITSLSNNDLLRFGFTPGAHTGDDDLVLTNLSITITQL